MTGRSYIVKEAYCILSPVGFWMSQSGEHIILRYSTWVEAVVHELDPHTTSRFLKVDNCIPKCVEDPLPNVEPNVFLEDPKSQREVPFLLDGQKPFEVELINMLAV